MKINKSLLLYRLFSLLPLRNTVVGSSFYGMRYENNPRFVFEALEKYYPEVKKVWLTKKDNQIKFPDYVIQKSGKLAEIYYYATSKVWVNSHFFPEYIKKRKGQLSILIYHGGIGIKRNSNDVPSREKSEAPGKSADNTSLAVSNSLFMNHVYRGSLEYKGPILRCGYPKDDPLFEEQRAYKENVCNYYNIPQDKHILFYAPTYRQDKENISNYTVNLGNACAELERKFGGEWVPIVRWHPHQGFLTSKTKEMFGNKTIDATNYGNMQELIIASDAFITDYSSCIFEAAERKIPCFSYATDWEKFKQEQGVFFDIDKLPFPYCKNNMELIRSIAEFDEKKYIQDLNVFWEKEGLKETGRASFIVANIISRFLAGERDILKTLPYEE